MARDSCLNSVPQFVNLTCGPKAFQDNAPLAIAETVSLHSDQPLTNDKIPLENMNKDFNSL